jgi:hypothetical protein
MIRPLRVLLAALLAGCHALFPIRYDVEPQPAVYGCARDCADSDQVAVNYLGVSGFLISYRGRSLLTAPLFSNPSIWDVAPRQFYPFWHAPTIRPDTQLIDRLLPRAADSASMILVGHSHYDHLLDVPWIARNRATRAAIYGTPTTRHILMGDAALRADSSRVRAVSDADLGTASKAGRWFYDADSTFRVMALAADHAPTVRFLGVSSTFAKGALDTDQDALPRAADEWLLGETYTYLIDILQPGDPSPRFRIYYQDAPNTAPLGFPPRSVIAERPIDLAILCLATASNTRPVAPAALLQATRPSYVIAAHWESFFQPQIYPLYLNPASDITRFVAALHENLPSTSRWSLPLPRTVMHYAVPRSGR